MSDAPDAELLKEFARNQSEAAFAALVRRHVGLVYSVALRQTANTRHAEDITQAVFIILARKAAALSPKTVLAGWLYHTARLTAANFQRAEMRRVRREQEVFMQSTPPESPSDAVWHELSPLLDDAMARLSATDRDAIVLRFFLNQSLADVGAALGIAERAAQKRVNRALEKLNRFFTRQGVSSTTAIIAGAISNNSVHAAPVMLVKTVTVLAMAKGAAASASTLTLAKGALKVMAWSKVKTAIVVGIGILLVAGTGTVMVKNSFFSSQPSYQGKPLSAWLKEYENVKETFANNGAKLHELDKIVSQAGTNAIPTLLRLLREEDFKGDGNGAANGFRVLGTRATNAVPDLMKIYEQNQAARDDILYSLNCIGTNADVPIDWLLPKLKDPDPKIRAGIAYVIGQMHTESEQAIPALIQCLSDSSSHVRADAALALGSCGADAKSAIPQLIVLLNDKGKGVKNCAAFAIKEIDPETAVKLRLQ
jgi:RNA polymerase sigma factor (sigma-70 family)